MTKEEHPKREQAIAELLHMAGALPTPKDTPTRKQIKTFEGISYKAIIRPLITAEREEDPDCTYAYFACKWQVSERTIRYILNKT